MEMNLTCVIIPPPALLMTGVEPGQVSRTADLKNVADIVRELIAGLIDGKDMTWIQEGGAITVMIQREKNQEWGTQVETIKGPSASETIN